jgi:small subunit ribosomal protein S18
MVRKAKLKVSTRLLRKKARRSTLFTKKQCRFCSSDAQAAGLNYKNAALLKNFMTERYKILPSRISGNCARHQRILANEIKKARIVALLPFSSGQL